MNRRPLRPEHGPQRTMSRMPRRRRRTGASLEFRCELLGDVHDHDRLPVGSHPEIIGGVSVIDNRKEVPGPAAVDRSVRDAVPGRPGPDGASGYLRERNRSVSGRGDYLVRFATTASVALLAVIAAVVSYGHMHALVLSHGEGSWASALIPLSVDGMIVASSMSLLLESRLGGRGGVLPWVLLIVGALASLGANIAVAEPTVVGRVIAAWPSFALTASYELLMRQVRSAAGSPMRRLELVRDEQVNGSPRRPPRERRAARHPVAGREVRREAWEWALAQHERAGSLPSGKVIAGQFGRHERWGRLVKQAGMAGQFGAGGPQSPQPGRQVTVAVADA
jgi:Protein of unknown function (DUF2637)